MDDGSWTNVCQEQMDTMRWIIIINTSNCNLLFVDCGGQRGGVIAVDVAVVV